VDREARQLIDFSRNNNTYLDSVGVAKTAASPDPDLVRVLRALSNPTRLQLLLWLREPRRHFPLHNPAETDVGVCVSHIQAKAGLAQSTVSAYLAELEQAGLVRSTRVGKWTHYKRDEKRIAAVLAALGRAL
jgi:DNA-binding transcriptional ArsR family regulator